MEMRLLSRCQRPMSTDRRPPALWRLSAYAPQRHRFSFLLDTQTRLQESKKKFGVALSHATCLHTGPVHRSNAFPLTLSISRFPVRAQDHRVHAAGNNDFKRRATQQGAESKSHNQKILHRIAIAGVAATIGLLLGRHNQVEFSGVVPLLR